MHPQPLLQPLSPDSRLSFPKTQIQIAIRKTPREQRGNKEPKREAINNAKYCVCSLSAMSSSGSQDGHEICVPFNYWRKGNGNGLGMGMRMNGWMAGTMAWVTIRFRQDGMKCLSGNFSLHKLCGKRAGRRTNRTPQPRQGIARQVGVANLIYL